MAEAIPKIFINKEELQNISHAKIAFELCCFVKNCCDASHKKSIAYQHIPDFDRRHIVSYRANLTCHSIVARFGQDQWLYEIWN